MPSPFPGMDPNLESPRCFADFHDGMNFCMKTALQRGLPQNYFAESNERIWVETSERLWSPMSASPELWHGGDELTTVAWP